MVHDFGGPIGLAWAAAHADAVASLTLIRRTSDLTFYGDVGAEILAGRDNDYLGQPG